MVAPQTTLPSLPLNAAPLVAENARSAPPCFSELMPGKLNAFIDSPLHAVISVSLCAIKIADKRVYAGTTAVELDPLGHACGEVLVKLKAQSKNSGFKFSVKRDCPSVRQLNILPDPKPLDGQALFNKVNDDAASNPPEKETK